MWLLHSCGSSRGINFSKAGSRFNLRFGLTVHKVGSSWKDTQLVVWHVYYGPNYRIPSRKYYLFPWVIESCSKNVLVVEGLFPSSSSTFLRIHFTSDPQNPSNCSASIYFYEGPPKGDDATSFCFMSTEVLQKCSHSRC